MPGGIEKDGFEFSTTVTVHRGGLHYPHQALMPFGEGLVRASTATHRGMKRLAEHISGPQCSNLQDRGRAKVEGLRSARRTSSRSEAELERTLENDELCLYSSLYLLACYRAYIGLLPPWRSLSALRDSRNLQKHSTFESQGTHFASGRHYGQDFGSLLCLLSNNN